MNTNISTLCAAVRDLAKEADICIERASQLCEQAEFIPESSPCPVILAGSALGVLGLLLDRWLGTAAADAFREAVDLTAPGTPLLIASAPQQSGVTASHWPTFASRAAGDVPLIVIDTSRPILREPLTKLIQTLSSVRLLVAVTSHGQSLPAPEAEALASLSAVASAAKTLAIVLPGERYGDDDVAKVLQRCKHMIEGCGFGGVRYLGYHFLPLDSSSTHPSAISDPSALFGITLSEAASAHEAMLASSACALLNDIATRAETRGDRPLAAIDESEATNIRNGCAADFSRLHASIETALTRDASHTEEQARALVLSGINTWDLRSGIAVARGNEWQLIARGRFESLEQLRPGTLGKLKTAATEKLALLTLAPPAAEPVTPSKLASSGIKRLLVRCGCSAACGILFYGLATLGAPIAIGFFQSIGLMAGAVLGYALSGHFHAAVSKPRVEALPQSGAGGDDPHRLRGWDAFAEALFATLDAQIARTHLAIPARCRELKETIRNARH